MSFKGEGEKGKNRESTDHVCVRRPDEGQKETGTSADVRVILKMILKCKGSNLVAGPVKEPYSLSNKASAAKI